MCIFITGGCGFIGSNLVKVLLANNVSEIRLYDNFSMCESVYLEGILAKVGSYKKRSYKKGVRYTVSTGEGDAVVKVLIADILDESSVRRAMKGSNTVVHLAAHTRVLESLEMPKLSFEANSIGFSNVIDAARMCDVERFVFASSNAAVGEQISPVDEMMVAKPLSPYGASKLHGEALCSAYYQSYGLKTVALRFANAYGAYSDHKTSVVSHFFKMARGGRRLEIFGDGKQTRDFIDAEDIARAICICVVGDFKGGRRMKLPWGEVFQIATGVETSIGDLAQKINMLVGNEAGILFRSQRKGEIIKNHSDPTKARKILKFKSKISLLRGLERMNRCNV